MSFRLNAQVAIPRRRAPVPRLRVAGFVGCVAFVAATILYALGTAFWSGKTVARFDVRNGSPVPAADVRNLGPGEHARRVGPVVLQPEMNPVRVLLGTRHRRLFPGQSADIAVTLRGSDGQLLWSEGRAVVGSSGTHRRRGPSRTLDVLGDVDVPHADTYTLDVTVRGPAAAWIRRVNLELRRNVAFTDARLLWGGGAAALASLLLGLLGGRMRRGESQPDRLAA